MTTWDYEHGCSECLEKKKCNRQYCPYEGDFKLYHTEISPSEQLLKGQGGRYGRRKKL